MEKSFKHLAGKEHRTAIEMSLGEAERNLQEHSKGIKLLERKIVILKRFLSGA